MNNANRRGFLKIAGAGAAAAGAASLAPSGVSMAGTPTAAVVGDTKPTPELSSTATGSMAAYIHDASTGEIVVMIEGREVVVTDHDLVARLADAVHTVGAVAV